MQVPGPTGADHPRRLCLGPADVTYAPRCDRIAGCRQAETEHGGGYGETSFPADTFLDRDFDVRARIQATYIVQHKRPGRHHGGVNQRAVLAHFYLCRAVGDPLDLRALALLLKGVLGQHLHAGDLCARQHRVIEVDLPGLQHCLMAGEGPLRVGLQVGAAR